MAGLEKGAICTAVIARRIGIAFCALHRTTRLPQRGTFQRIAVACFAATWTLVAMQLIPTIGGMIVFTARWLFPETRLKSRASGMRLSAISDGHPITFSMSLRFRVSETCDWNQIFCVLRPQRPPVAAMS